MSKDTGRPQEQGGHQRMNISVDQYSREVLDSSTNKSKFIEQSIRDFTQLKVKKLEETNESQNASRIFKNGATFEYQPLFYNNKIENIGLSFNYFGAKGEVEFRVCINDCKGLTLLEKSSSGEYTSSHYYNNDDLGLKKFESMLRGKDKYIIKFQFRPVTIGCRIKVNHIVIFLEVIDTPVINSTKSEMAKHQGRSPIFLE